MSVPSEGVISAMALGRGIKSPYDRDLLHLFGYKLDSGKIPKLFAQKLRQAEYYKPKSDDGAGHDLPVMLWNF